MSGLIVPRHIATSARRQKSETAAANSIQSSSVNILSSDDFVTRDQAKAQIDELRAYIEGRRAEDPHYALPRPIGWRVSVLMLTIPEKTQGGVHLVDENREARALSSPQGIVLSLAEGAFKDPARFMVDGEIHPWIKVGDRVLWKKYDVTMFQLGNGQRLGFMNDTQAYGVIDHDWETPV
jgi:co-chaperonin GroES (HSP10)